MGWTEERCWENDADDGAARKEETGGGGGGGGRPKRRFMDAVREDMTEEDAEERTEWRRRIGCGDPYKREQPNTEATQHARKFSACVHVNKR